jgi:hypothetical protein
MGKRTSKGTLRPGEGGLSVQVKAWPTPAAQDGKNGTCPPSQANRDTLPGAMIREQWPTPKSATSGPDFARTAREGSGGDDLATSVAREQTDSLNPAWVEQLMGFPDGWLDLDPKESGPRAPAKRRPRGKLAALPSA